MPTIDVRVQNKIAAAVEHPVIICGNSDYEIKFVFDTEWDEFHYKTARFVWNNKHEDVVFEGTVCQVPVIANTNMVSIGVFAGDLHTTTPAYIAAQKSILCNSGSPFAPSNDVYAQIMEEMNRLAARLEVLEQGGSVSPNPATAILGIAKLGSLKLA